MLSLILIVVKATLLLLISEAPSSSQQDGKPKECISQRNARAAFNKQAIPESFRRDGNVRNVDTRIVSITKGQYPLANETYISALAADKALKIVSDILSSNEFKSAVGKLDFSYKNHCSTCGENDASRTERIPGAVVLDSIYRKPEVVLDLSIKEGRCNGALGSTCPGYTTIKSNYRSIKCDMGNLPIEYAYAVHLCHEYMHIVGFCHTDWKDDVAEKIGWIAYYIALGLQKKSGS